jgi:hypothetical protein
MTLPQPGQWVRVRHACPDVGDFHCAPVQVTAVVSVDPHTRIQTRRCDGREMNLYADRHGVPVAGDEWEVVT